MRRHWFLALLLLRSPAYATIPRPAAALIQIGIEVVEVDELKTQKLGIDWVNTLLLAEDSAPAILKVGTFDRSRITATLQALTQEGAADLLANPKLVTRDGSTATFHAGGELPYATAYGAAGSATVEFKPYGVRLKINPRIDQDQRIAMVIEAEVSGPDEQNSVSLSGNTVPGIRTRQVTSELTMTPGSTLTMAGLIQNEKQTLIKGVPGLMHIPVLGYLFRHRTQSRRRTSVVVFITPIILEVENNAVSQPS